MTAATKLKILTRSERIFVFQFFGSSPELSLHEHQQEVPQVHA